MERWGEAVVVVVVGVGVRRRDDRGHVILHLAGDRRRVAGGRAGTAAFRLHLRPDEGELHVALREIGGSASLHGPGRCLQQTQVVGAGAQHLTSRGTWPLDRPRSAVPPNVGEQPEGQRERQVDRTGHVITPPRRPASGIGPGWCEA